MDVFLVDGLSGNRLFTLNLEPRGQLLLKIAFTDMGRSFARLRQPSGVFGQPLTHLLQREHGEVPLVLSRLIGQIESRSLDRPGLYYLCGATERKQLLRAQFNENSREADITERPVPDVNLLTGLVNYFLRELPEPLVPTNIYSMLLDANAVMPTADQEGNQKLVMRIVDCLPTSNKNSLVLLMEHLRSLLGSEPHNGLNMQRLTGLFGQLIFCTAATTQNPPSQHQQQIQLQKQQMEGEKSMIAEGSAVIQSGAVAVQAPTCIKAMSKWIRCVLHRRPRLYGCCLITGQESTAAVTRTLPRAAAVPQMTKMSQAINNKNLQQKMPTTFTTSTTDNTTTSALAQQQQQQKGQQQLTECHSFFICFQSINMFIFTYSTHN